MSRPRRPWRLVAASGGWVRVEPHAGGRWRVRMLVDEEPVSEEVWGDSWWADLTAAA